MPEQDLPPWLSRVTFDQADGLQTTGIVQLPLTYAGPSIPLAWPWTSVNGQGEVLVSLLGGTGFQTLPETTLTAVISTEAPQETQASPAPTAPFVTTDDTGQQITIPGVISTLPDGSETIVPASPTATPAPPATAYLTETDSDGQPTATVPGVVSSITAESGDTLTTIPATESTLENGQTTLIPITRVAPSATDQRQPVTTTATLDGTPTTATGFLSTLPDGSTTAIFSSLSSLSNSDSDSDSSSTSDASSSTTESSMSSSISSSSEPSSSGASDSDNGLSDGQLAGIIVGSIVFALFLAALCALCCCFRRRRQRRHGSDTGWTMVTNGSAGHQRLSDRTEDEEEEDIDIDPRQLFMLPPAEYEGFGQQPMREVERESGSSRSGSTGRSFGLLPPSRFSNRHSQGPRPMASYHTVATTDPNGSVSSSLKEPPPDIAPKLSTSAASSEPSRQLLDTSEPSVFSHLSPNPFSPYADNNSRTITSPPTSDVPSQDRFNKRLPTIPSSSEIDSQDAAEMLASSELDEQAPGSGNSSRPELPRPAGGISGLGLGMLFGLVGHGRRAISLNGADDFAERENKRSTTSDPLPRSKRSQMFEDSPTLDSVPRRVEISSSSSSDGESDNEETAFLPYTANSGSADPLVTRWSRTTFGKKIGSSVGSGSAAQSMAGSILSRQSGSNQASLSSNAKRRANSVGRRAVSESDSVHSSTRGSRRTQNSSGSSSGHSHSKSSKRSQSRLRQEVPRVMPDAGSSVLERSDDEDETKPTIRTVKRTQSGTSVYT